MQSSSQRPAVAARSGGPGTRDDPRGIQPRSGVMSIRNPAAGHPATADETLKTVASITPLPSEPAPEPGRGSAGIRPLRAAPSAGGGELPPPAGQVIPAFGLLREGERTGRLIH